MSLLNLLAQDDNAEMKMDISFDLKLHKLDAFSQSNILFDPLGTELEMLPVFSFGLSEVGPYAFTMPTCNNCLNALLQSVVLVIQQVLYRHGHSMEIFAPIFALSVGGMIGSVAHLFAGIDFVGVLSKASAISRTMIDTSNLKGDFEYTLLSFILALEKGNSPII
ncbi:hypothetical protein ACJX0J_013158, partial [Zea mays]